MKYYQCLLFLFIICQAAVGQDCFNSSSSKFSKIKSSTLLIVSEPNDTTYNRLLIESFNQFWKYSKFKIIERSELESYFGKEGYVFHGPFRYIVNSMDCNMFGIWGAWHGKQVNRFDELSPLAYMNVENIFDNSTYNFCLPQIVKSLNDFLFYAEANNLSGGMRPLFRSLSPMIVKYYNSKAKVLKNKTLMILEDYVDDEGKFFIAKNYKGKIEFVKKSDVTEAIENKDENKCYLYLAQSPVSIFMYVYDANSGDIVLVETDTYAYSNGDTKRLKLNSKNLKSLVESLNKNSLE